MGIISTHLNAIYLICHYKPYCLNCQSVVLGFGIGVIFGIFTASVDPMSTYAGASDKPPSTREYIREAKARSVSYGKNFAVVGMMFAGIECMVESVSQTTTTH